MTWFNMLKGTKENDLRKVTEFFESITGIVLMDRRDGRYVHFFEAADKKTQDLVLRMIETVETFGGPNTKKAHGIVVLIGSLLRDSNETQEKEDKPHLTWIDPSKTVGWKDGVLNMALDNWASANRGGYTESISDTYKEKEE